ncbi:putative histidine phosphotransferase [Moniliophthora roreri]|nr:putative histidine phosphotransferase [Moniliophthora roreri]
MTFIELENNGHLSRDGRTLQFCMCYWRFRMSNNVLSSQARKSHDTNTEKEFTMKSHLYQAVVGIKRAYRIPKGSYQDASSRDYPQYLFMALMANIICLEQSDRCGSHTLAVRNLEIVTRTINGRTVVGSSPSNRAFLTEAASLFGD